MPVVHLSSGWNFGPRDEDAQPVMWIVERMAKAWGEGAGWRLDLGEHPHEAHYLKLDVSKARHRLGWQPRWNLDTALSKITHWHRAWRAQQDMKTVCLEQITQYTNSIDKESA